MKILLALDHSEYSKAALGAVLVQIPAKGNEVRVLHVVDVIDAYFAEGMLPMLTRQAALIMDERRKQGKKLLESAVRALREAGFRASVRLQAGEPKERILKCAEAWPADLIVLGSHGWTGYRRLLMGSVSEAVMRHAPCSVEIVRAVVAAKQAPARRPAR